MDGKSRGLQRGFPFILLGIKKRKRKVEKKEKERD